MKKFHFSTTNGKKIMKLEDFRRNNCVFTKTNGKNCSFKRINHNLNFVFFLRSNHIFTQPIAKKAQILLILGDVNACVHKQEKKS